MMLKHAVFFAALTVFFCVFQAVNVYPQAGVSLQAEIKNIESAAARQGITAAERHAALTRLARIRQLSGDIEGAARNWLEAAAAIPGAVDDNALLSCAYCLAAMGEWDRAAVALEPLVSKNIRARFLDTGIKAIKSGDTSALAVIADNAAFSEVKHEIIFLLWKISRGAPEEMWRQRLTAEFPQTPEGRLAAANEQFIMNPSPFWFFIGGLDSLPLLANETRTENREQRTENREQRTENREQITREQVTREQVTREQPTMSHNAAQLPAQTSVRVQTGVFSREANAQTQAASLRSAGFSPAIERRGDMWAVTVPAGQDANRTVNDLRAAGFDSFIIR